MRKMLYVVLPVLLFILISMIPSHALARHARTYTHGSINAKSAILVDMGDGRILYEQDADAAIPPASITKVLSLYLIFEALHEGRLHATDRVTVSSRAAQTGGSRMGLKTGHIVPVEELVKGMAVVSGNDACVAMAEYMAGSVEAFVRLMNIKARELGMSHSHFTTPNGLPSPGQFTTARDIAKLSVAYLRRFPESLNIHSMQSYTYRNITHHNANRLLATCPGVDGLKTGFVCAAGYNLSATCKRGDTRLLAVVLGARSAGVRATETARLLELGYQTIAAGSPVVKIGEEVRHASNCDSAGEGDTSREITQRSRSKRLVASTATASGRRGRASSRSRSKQQVAAVAPGPRDAAATKGQVVEVREKTGRRGRQNNEAQPASVRTASRQKAPAPSKVTVADPPDKGKAAMHHKETAPSNKKVTKTAKSAPARSKSAIQGSDKPAPGLRTKETCVVAKRSEPRTASAETSKKKRTP